MPDHHSRKDSPLVRRAVSVCVLAVVVMSRSASSHALAGDWPQILGPNRNGVAADDERLVPWKEATGPPVVWERPVGEGLAGVAVAQGKVILFHREGDREIVESLSTTDGEQLWEFDYSTSYRSGISPDSGPRCVPIIDQDCVVTFGAEGQLTCLDFESGKARWSVDTQVDFQPLAGYFGAGSTPIVMGDKVIVNVGGSGAGVVAFDRGTGQVAWRATDEAASYSAPTSAQFDGQTYLLVETRLQFLGLDPETGAVRFRVPFGARGPTVNGATPVVMGNHVFLTASYGIGATLVQVSDGKAKQLWNKSNLISSQYVTPVPLGTTLFGVDGRDDAGSCHLKAVNALSAEIYWTQRDFGYATVTRAADKLLLLGTEGNLVLVAADSSAYNELARSELFKTTTRALPALARGRLYARDTKSLKCVQVGKSSG